MSLESKNKAVIKVSDCTLSFSEATGVSLTCRTSSALAQDGSGDVQLNFSECRVTATAPETGGTFVTVKCTEEDKAAIEQPAPLSNPEPGNERK